MRQGGRGVEGISQSKTMSLPNRVSTKAEQSIFIYSLSEPIKCNPKQAYHQTKTSQQKRTKNKQKNAETQLKSNTPKAFSQVRVTKNAMIALFWGWEHTFIRFFFQQKQSTKARLLFKWWCKDSRVLKAPLTQWPQSAFTSLNELSFTAAWQLHFTWELREMKSFICATQQHKISSCQPSDLCLRPHLLLHSIVSPGR